MSFKGKRKETWNEKYDLLKKYYEKHGNIDIPRCYSIKGIDLGNWLTCQRQAYKGQGTYKITPAQIKLLNDLKIKWDFREESWDEKYKLLKKYYEEYGDINIPESYEVDDIRLGAWLSSVKIAYVGKGNRRITPAQIKLLNDLNIDWNIKNTRLLNSKITEENKKEYNVILLERLKHILEDLLNEGYNEIDNKEQKEIEEIIIKRMWCQRSNDIKRNKKMFGKRKEIWLKKYELLKEYYKEYGNTDIAQLYEVDEINLGKWISTLRQAYKGKGSSKITIEQIKMLNGLNFDWDIKDTRLLNLDITRESKKEYNVVLLERLKNILEDLVNEEIDEIDSIERQKEIEKIIIKRMWR